MTNQNYSDRLSDLLDNMASTLFCMGQDWEKGDGSPSRVEEISAETKISIDQLLLDIAMEAVGKNDRDYSQDNADEQSKTILVACSQACNELRQEIRTRIKQLVGAEK